MRTANKSVELITFSTNKTMYKPMDTLKKTKNGYLIVHQRDGIPEHSHDFDNYRTCHAKHKLDKFEGSSYGITYFKDGYLEIPIEMLYMLPFSEPFENDLELFGYYKSYIRQDSIDEEITHFKLFGREKTILTLIKVIEMVKKYLEKETGIYHIEEGIDERGDFLKYSYSKGFTRESIKRSKYKTLVELLRDFNKGKFTLEEPPKVSNSSL